MSTIDELRTAVSDGDQAGAVSAATRGLDEGISAATLLEDGLLAAMRDVGKLFEDGEVFVPEMLVASHAMRAALEVLRPGLVEHDVKSNGRVAIGTVRGDLHDIGKNLVTMMLESAGYEVTDLGVDVYPERFVEAVRDGAEIVGISALLTTTMTNMPDVVAAIRDAGLRERVGIVIGGAPITESYAAEIGADGYAKDASSAARMVAGIIDRVRAGDGSRSAAP